MIDPIAVLVVCYGIRKSLYGKSFGADGGRADLCDWISGGKENRRLRELAISTLEIAYLAGGCLRALPLAGNYKILCSKNNKGKEKRGTMAPENPWRSPVLANESVTWAGSREHGGPAGVPADVIGLILEHIFVHRRRRRKAALHAQLLAQEDWVLSYAAEADHSFMEPGTTRYCFVDVLPPLRDDDEGVAYVDDTRAAWALVTAEVSRIVWDASRVSGDLYLRSDEKLMPPTNGVRILGCEMSLADELSRVEVPGMNHGTGIDSLD